MHSRDDLSIHSLSSSSEQPRPQDRHGAEKKYTVIWGGVIRIHIACFDWKFVLGVVEICDSDWMGVAGSSLIELLYNVAIYRLCKEWNTVLIQLADDSLDIQHQTLFLRLTREGKKAPSSYNNGVGLIHDTSI